MTFASAVCRRALKVGGATLSLLSMVALAGSAQSGFGTTNDPRVGLKAGRYDAGTAAKGLELIGSVHRADTLDKTPNPRSLTFINSDLALGGHYVYQGNFSGFEIWDIADAAHPKLVNVTVCPTDQGDPSIYGHLLFISDESGRGRTDCGTGPTTDPKLKMRGVRIFDVSDPAHPKLVANVQNCRGSHTHTLVEDLKDKADIYVYTSGTSPARPQAELAGCAGAEPPAGLDAGNQFSYIDVIKVPLAHPELAAVVNHARIFDGMTAAARGHGNPPGDTAAGRGGRGGGARGGRGGAQFVLPIIAPLMPHNSPSADTARAIALYTSMMTAGADTVLAKKYVDSLRLMGVSVALPANGRGGRGAGGGRGNGGPQQCHDITVYPAIGLAGAACATYGILLDIKDPVHPRRLAAVSDTNFSFWHSATFSNDGSMLLFSDEWGGGQAPRCRSIDPIIWGGDAIFDVTKDDQLQMKGYYKMPAVQTDAENCVAHNGALVPVPGRTIMSQGWYQGGVSVFDFTDPSHPHEIAYFDRGPFEKDTMYTGGYWCAYWYNGHIIASELLRGLDVFDLKPTESLTQNEIDAANTVHFDQLNAQDQPKIVWPASFPLMKALLDQVKRTSALTAAQTTAITNDIAAAESASGNARKNALNKVASDAAKDMKGSAEAKRLDWIGNTAKDLAKTTK